jgi:hypothetical protein
MAFEQIMTTVTLASTLHGGMPAALELQLNPSVELPGISVESVYGGTALADLPEAHEDLHRFAAAAKAVVKNAPNKDYTIVIQGGASAEDKNTCDAGVTTRSKLNQRIANARGEAAGAATVRMLRSVGLSLPVDVVHGHEAIWGKATAEQFQKDVGVLGKMCLGKVIAKYNHHELGGSPNEKRVAAGLDMALGRERSTIITLWAPNAKPVKSMILSELHS